MDSRPRRSARVQPRVEQGRSGTQKYAGGKYIIEHSPVLAGLVVLELVLDHTDDNVITHEASSIHDLLSLNAEGRLARDLVAEEVASREVADAELFLNLGGLRTLPCGDNNGV